MKRELFVLRHSKSDWSQAAVSDKQRPLNDRGKRDAVKMAKWIKSNNYRPNIIYCSTARRAMETISPLVNISGLPESSVYYEDRLYLASLTTLLNFLAQIDSNMTSVMIVGHNPGLDELVSYLAETSPPLTDNGKLMTTTCLAHFAMPENWQSLLAKAKLISITRPKELN